MAHAPRFVYKLYACSFLILIITVEREIKVNIYIYKLYKRLLEQKKTKVP